MGKNSKKYWDAYYADQTIYVRDLETAVQALMPALAQMSPPIVDFHFVGPLVRTPDNHTVWYVVATRNEVQRGQAAGLPSDLHAETVSELRKRGYPQSGINTLTVLITSQQDIDAAGGAFAYFR